ncbi:MAG: hypothetical protein K1X28_00475 [Parachlamydiales bacterium]|nr:hypothetical protein [Parachlamydiales bacterium]
MFRVEYRPSGDSSKVEKFLTDKNPQKALDEALEIPFLFQRDDALEKIVNFHLAKGDIQKAESAATHISYLSTSSWNFKKIFEAYLAKNDTISAKRAALKISYLSEQNQAIEKIIDHHIAKGDLTQAESLLSDLNMSSSISRCAGKIFNIYFEKKDFSSAKRILASASSISKDDAAKMLDHELAANQLTEALKTSQWMGETGVKKVAKKIEETKPNEETLTALEKLASILFWFMPSLEKIILNALISVYQSMGKESEVERLKKKIEELDKGGRIFEHIRTAFAIPAGVYSGIVTLSQGATPQVAGLVGAGTAIAFKYPTILKIQNLLGLGAGMAASASGYGPLAATGIGLGTSFVTRVPVIRDAASWTANTGISVLKTGGNAVLWTAETAGNAMLWTAEKTLRAVGTVVEGVFSGISATGGLIASAVKGVDSALDVLSGN